MATTYITTIIIILFLATLYGLKKIFVLKKLKFSGIKTEGIITKTQKRWFSSDEGGDDRPYIYFYEFRDNFANVIHNKFEPPLLRSVYSFSLTLFKSEKIEKPLYEVGDKIKISYLENSAKYNFPIDDLEFEISDYKFRIVGTIAGIISLIFFSWIRL